MNTLAWNKVIAALLLGILLYKGIEIFADSAFEVPEVETRAYVVEGLVADEPEVAEAAPVEAPAPSDDIMALLAAASPEQGKRIFRGCQACHDVNQGTGHKIGPNLYGIMGAPVAQHADYKYSDALAEHGGTWDFQMMDDWLASPADVVPGNKMSYRGVSRAGDRAALIAFMNSNSDNPLALPTAPAPEAMEEVADETIEEVVEEAMPVPGESVEEMMVEPSEETAPEETSEDAPEEAPDEIPEEAGPGEGGA